MTTSIIGAGGEIVECNFGNKISELYDSIYIEVETIKERYNDIIKGIVVDNNKFDHIVKSLLNTFKVKNCKELIKLLNSLNASYAPSIHIKFFFDKFGISDDLITSIDKKLKDINKKNINLYENIISIYSYYNDKELEKIFNLFVKSVENGYLENPKLKKNHPNNIIISLDECKNNKDLNQIMFSIERLQLIHTFIISDITEIYKNMNNITNKINLIKS